jgi:hypothetical protein
VTRKSQQPLGFMESDASRMAREGGSTFEIASPKEHVVLVHQICSLRLRSHVFPR